MEENKSIDLLDYIILIVKWKRFLIILSLFVALLSYSAIYFFIDEQFEATAVILPTDDKSMGVGISSMLKNLGNMPFNLGRTSKDDQLDLFVTIINSRTNLIEIIKKFDLYNEYKLFSLEKTIKSLKENIKTSVTDENSFEIKVRASSKQKAADMTNFVLDLLNKKIIELNISKAKDNRIFLEKRYDEIKTLLINSEEELKDYQEKFGVFEAKEQVKSTIEAYSKLETELAAKKVEFSVFEKIYGGQAPQTKNLKISVEEFQLMVDKIKNQGDKQSLILPITTLPQKAVEYFRLFRDVEIYTKMLEIIIPLYEQSKFEEQKDIPILQVIDYAAPPEKKSYPPRLLFTIIITFGSLLIAFLYIVFMENKELQNSEKINYIKRNIFSFRRAV